MGLVLDEGEDRAGIKLDPVLKVAVAEPMRDRCGVVMKYLDCADWEASFRAMRAVARQLAAALVDHTDVERRNEALRVAREAGIK